MTESTLSYRIAKPVRPAVRQWRGLLRTIGVFCLIFGIVQIQFAWEIWRTNSVLGRLYFDVTFSSSHFVGVTPAIFDILVPLHVIASIMVCVGAIGTLSFRADARKILLSALLLLLTISFTSTCLETWLIQVQNSFIDFKAPLGTSASIEQFFALSSIITGLFYRVLPGIILFEILRRVPATMADEVYLYFSSSVPRGLIISGILSILIGLGGIFVRANAVFSRNPWSVHGITPAWVGALVPHDLSLMVWLLGSRLILLGCCLCMVIGGLGVVLGKPWAMRLLVKQAGYGIIVNTVDVGLTFVLIYYVLFARSVSAAVLSPLMLQCMSIGFDATLRFYCGTRKLKAWAKGESEDLSRDPDPVSTFRMNPGFDQQ